MDLEALTKNSDFQTLITDVREALNDTRAATPDLEAVLQAERKKLESQCRGWVSSLGVEELDDAVRQELLQEIATARNRIAGISTELASRAAQINRGDSVLDPQLVHDCLQQLGSILGSQNASAVNVMLSQHIEGIHCDKTGRVVVRTCRLGALAGALDIVPRAAVTQSPEEAPDPQRAVPRRRSRMDLAGAIEDDDEADAANDFAVDPSRFAGLDEKWFREDVFQVPKKRSWAALHAAEVATYRLETHASMERTARHFEKTVPTIREALRFARDELSLDALGKTVSRPTLPNWSREHAEDVAAFLATGRLLKEAVAHFGKSEPTIRKALEFAQNRGSSDEDDR